MDGTLRHRVVDDIKAVYAEGRPAVAVIELASGGLEADGVLHVRTCAVGPAGEVHACSQLDVLLGMCSRYGLKPRTLILAAGVSGTMPFEDRPDFAALFEAVDEGCTWMAISSADRLARCEEGGRMMLEASHGCGLKVYVGETGRLLDLADPEVMMWRVAAIASEMDRLRRLQRRGRRVSRTTTGTPSAASAGELFVDDLLRRKLRP